MQYNTGTGQYVDVDGMIVESDTLRVAEAINDYDPNLVVLCIDPDHVEGISEEPFVIAEKGKDGVLRPVLRAWVLDDLVLQRIQASDTARSDPFHLLETMEEKAKKASRSRYNDIREETRDIVAHIAGIKSKYTVRDTKTGELITFYDDRPATRK